MKKDPAFLFYSKDWIEGTAGLLPAEKGVYMDLLAHQHQKKFLPSDTVRLARLASMSEPEFMVIWEHLKEKFVEVEPGKLMNKRLKLEMDERKDKGHKNKIIGQFASLIRQAKISPVQKEQIKQTFKIDDFLPLTTELATERLSKWFSIRLKSIEDANEDGNANRRVEGMGEEKVQLPADGFFSDKIDKEIELSEMQTNATIEFISLICKVTLLEDDVGEYWRAFKIQQLGKHEWYNSFEDLLSHFRNSLKLSLGKNGSTKTNSNGTATTRSVASLLSGLDG